MIWGCFSGMSGRGGLWFLPKNTTMKSTTYIDCLENHLLPFYGMSGCHTFLHDGAPCHKSHMSMNRLRSHKINLIDWPGNSPDLNPIENLLSIRNNQHLWELLKWMWCLDLCQELLEKLARRMPRRITKVLALMEDTPSTEDLFLLFAFTQPNRPF